MDLCLQSIYDIVYPSDIEIVKQQLTNEKKTTTVSSEDSPSESKCNIFNFKIVGKNNHRYFLGVPTFTKQDCLEIGNRRTFSCRISSRKKRSNRSSATTSPNGKRGKNTAFLILRF